MQYFIVHLVFFFLVYCNTIIDFARRWPRGILFSVVCQWFCAQLTTGANVLASFSIFYHWFCWEETAEAITLYSFILCHYWFWLREKCFLGSFNAFYHWFCAQVIAITTKCFRLFEGVLSLIWAQVSEGAKVLCSLIVLYYWLCSQVNAGADNLASFSVLSH